MVSYGIYYALGLCAAGALVTWLLSWPFAIPFYILAAFCLNFFRDPERESPGGPVAVSPADGKVVAVKAGRRGRPSHQHLPERVRRAREPHADRREGRVRNLQEGSVSGGEQGGCQRRQRAEHHHRGWRDRGAADPRGVQADRRTDRAPHHVLHEGGNMVEAGERIGLIKFGSRVDVILGPEWEVLVKAGQRVAGGSSILARFRGAA